MTDVAAAPPSPADPPLRAILFDLYGTLVSLADAAMLRDLPGALGIPRRRFVKLARRLLVTDLADTDAFVAHLCRELVGELRPQDATICRRLLDRELASVRPAPGVRTLLAFLDRRGLGLGLLSNLSSAHVGPLEQLGLEEAFDAVLLSCREGRAKPDPALYLEACRRLETAPQHVLSVGDSPVADVAAPRRLGLRAIRVGGPDAPPEERLDGVADLGWRALGGPEPLAPLLPAGRAVTIGGEDVTLCDLRPLPDDRQGRYNLVADVSAEATDGAVVLIGKRYLDPASAWVEAFAFELQGLVGLPTCAVAVVDDAEPVLLATRAAGEPFPDTVSPGAAYQLGRHTVFAYVFANADMRPRNAFLDASTPEPRMTMIDLEHCFLDIALDAELVQDRNSPHAIDRLDADRLRASAVRHVLTDRTLRRARAAYFPLAGTPDDVVEAYRQGVLDEYDHFAARADDICDAVRTRVYAEPYLVIGTRGYRRAMAGLDVDGIRDRLADDPQRVADVLCMPDDAFRARRRG